MPDVKNVLLVAAAVLAALLINKYVGADKLLA